MSAVPLPERLRRLSGVLRPLAVVLAMAAAHYLVFADQFPNDQGMLGHDYSLFLPYLMDGWLWIHNNGIWETHWFTPAFCGGVPVFANPQSVFHSVPQWLTLLVDPLWAVRGTFLIFSALGFAGFYLLLKGPFKLSAPAAFLGAAVFQFNGYFAYRLIIGGLPSHSFMLIGLITWLLLRRAPGELRPTWGKDILLAVPSALGFVYMFWSGANTNLIPYALGVAGLLLIHLYLFGPDPFQRFWIRFPAAVVLTVLLSLPKLNASLTLVRQFPREDYPLPGADGLMAGLTLLFQSLFMTAPGWGEAKGLVVNHLVDLKRFEWEYGVTWIPLILLVGGAAARWAARERPRPATSRRFRLGVGLLAAGLAVIPLALTVHAPGWSELLKSLPVINNASTPFRWWCAFIPLLALLTALAGSWFPGFRQRPWLSALTWSLLIAGVHLGTDRSYYHGQVYDPAPIVDFYHADKPLAWQPAITQIFVTTDETGEIAVGLNSNDGLVRGMSAISCHEPMFGYNLEYFPWIPMIPGSVSQIRNGAFNIKNPACYVAPEENYCQPGGHFTEIQRAEMVGFVGYHPFDFNQPGGHAESVFIAQGTIALLLVLLLKALVIPGPGALWSRLPVSEEAGEEGPEEGRKRPVKERPAER